MLGNLFFLGFFFKSSFFRTPSVPGRVEVAARPNQQHVRQPDFARLCRPTLSHQARIRQTAQRFLQ